MIVSCFCTNDVYAEYYRSMLSPSLKKYGLRVDLVEVVDLGGYRQNCLQKPRSILKTYQSCKDDVLYLDVDAEVKSTVDLSFVSSSMAAVFWREKLLASTLLFRRFRETEEFLEEWAALCDVEGLGTDQEVLNSMVERGGRRFEPLPIELGWVERWMRDVHPNKQAEIEHYALGKLALDGSPIR